MATPMQDEEVQRALLGVRNSAIPEPVADVTSTAAMLGVPDPTGGKAPPLSLEQIRAATEAAAPVSGPVNLNSGTAPAYVPPTIVGQKPPPPDTQATLPMGDTATEPLPPQPELRQSETRTQVTGGTKIDPKLEAERQSAIAGESKAIAQTAAITADAQAKIADVEQQKAVHLADVRRQQEEERKQQLKYADDQLERIRSAQAELDANRKAPEETIGQGFARSAALALGVLGRMLGGSIDVNEIVAKDKAAKLGAWTAQYDRMKGNVAGEQNVYAMLRQRGLDHEQAQAATLQRLNDDYASVIKTITAESASPLTLANANKAVAALAADNAAIKQKLYGDAQAKWTQVKDDKTKQGLDAGDVKDVREIPNKNEEIKAYKTARANLDRFVQLKNAGADGAALADFIANTMKQGSYTPSTFNEALKKRGWIDGKIESLRSMWSGGVPPDLLKELGDSLAIGNETAKTRAIPAIKDAQMRFRAAGIDPKLVLGAETSAEAAAGSGFEPEGKK